MSTEKTKQVIEGEISLDDLQNSTFSFDIGDLGSGDGLEIDTAAKPAEEEEENKNVPPVDTDTTVEGETEEEKQAAAEAAQAAKEKEEQEEEEKGKQTPAPSTSQFSFKNLASKYLEEGTWQDVEIEDEEGNSIKLSEAENIDEETFFAVQKAQGEFSTEEINEKYISKDGLDENALKVVEILKNGGDIKELYETPESFKKPFEGVDLDSETNQETILYQQYRRQGLSEKQANELIKIDKEDLTMDAKVQQIVAHYQKAYNTHLENKRVEQAEKRKKAEAETKEFKKGVMESLRDTFKIKDTLARKLTNLGVEKTSTGDFKIDEIYQQKMEDPKEAAELLFFLNDKDGYLKMMGAKTKRSANLNTLKKVSILKTQGKKEGGAGKEKSEDNSGFEFTVAK